MADNTRIDRNDNPEMKEKEEKMLEKENRMMRNVFIMRSMILSMQVKVAVDKIRTLERLEGISDTTNDTENYRNKAENAFSQNDYEVADIYMLKAEQWYSIMSAKLFPAKPKNNEKPSNEYLRMKRDKTSSNHAGVTVRGNKEDVIVCINKAKKAIAENDLEKAKKWLIKSQRILHTKNAQDLLDEVLDAIDARDAPKETPSVNPGAGPDDDDTNSIVDSNPEQVRIQIPTEPPSGHTVYNENIEGAKKCLDNANNAFKAKDLDNAERLLLKAKRMDASIDVEEGLQRVRDARAKNTRSRENAVPKEGPRKTEPPKKENIMDEANTYLQIAENAFKDKRYERALIFLAKSEALYTSEFIVKLRKQVKEAMSKPKKSYAESVRSVSGKKPSQSSYKEELDKLTTAIQNDIDAGNFDEAERKLQTPGIVKAVQLKKLRIEVEEKKALRKREDEIKTEENNPEPGEHVEPPQNEKLCNIHAKEAEMFINIADKAYNDGDLDKAKRLLEKAELLIPSERAKKALETVYTSIEEKKRLDNETPICNENENVSVPLEHATESIVNSEAQKLTNSGLDDMKKQNYYSAKRAFEKVKHLQPNNENIDGLLKDVENKIKKSKTKRGKKNNRHRQSTEGTSTGTQNSQNENPANDSDPIAAANRYTDWAQDAYDGGDIENAETFLRLAEVYNNTERSRKLLVLILRAKYGVKDNDSDDDSMNTLIVVEYSGKKNTYLNIVKGKGYLKSAEDAFIKGEFRVAKNLISKREIRQRPYVKEFKEKINSVYKRNATWYEKLFNNIISKIRK